MLALLAMLPLVASPSELPLLDSGLVHRVQSIGGSGGNGGNANVILQGPTTIYMYQQPGAGGNGGNAFSGAGPRSGVAPTTGAAPPIPPATGRSGVTSSVISKCTLKIAGKTVVDTTGCNYDKSQTLMQVRAPSETTDYIMKVVLNPDKSGQGFLSSAKTPAERDLGTMTRQGACWRNMDASVEICAWK
jgi:hypothetical protein